MSKELYDYPFYLENMEGSYRSALVYVQHLSRIFQPYSVVDVGCGRGSWLKAFRENGAVKLVGLDGNWNNQAEMVDQTITFFPTDLNEPLAKPVERFDLAISLEVAEHLKKDSSNVFVRNLISLSDVVMFGAAYTNQGGTNHINEQKHSYWANIFIENGYVPYDLFRPTLWGNENVEYWYQQNTFLYVKNSSIINQKLKKGGHEPIANIDFMNLIHPKLLDNWVQLYMSQFQV